MWDPLQEGRETGGGVDGIADVVLGSVGNGGAIGDRVWVPTAAAAAAPSVELLWLGGDGVKESVNLDARRHDGGGGGVLPLVAAQRRPFGPIPGPGPAQPLPI